MSWIKDNKFAAMLGGATLLGAIVLFYIGLMYHGRYAKSLENYQADAEQVKEFEEISLYPNQANRAGKAKALTDYRAAIGGLQTAFDKFRPKEVKNITPQGFTDHAKTANEEVAAAFEKAGTKLPEAFFLGFETYTGSLAREDATGLLDYQLGATKELMLALAKAAPSQLQNLYRPKFPEEDGEKWVAAADAAARAFPLEITFKGSEKSLREFLSAIVKSPDYFFVVRSLRIVNEKQAPPRLSDAKFEAPPAAPGAKPPAADPFGGADFIIPSDEPPAPAPTTPPAGTKPATAPGAKPATTPPAAAPAATRPPTATPAPAPVPATRPSTTKPAATRPSAIDPPTRPSAIDPPARPGTATPPPAVRPPATGPVPPVTTAPPAAPAAPRVDSSRILNKVLGGEELEVFLHIDVLEFLPVKALPEVPKSQS